MDICELEKIIGNTPVKQLGNTDIYVKLEQYNPAGSIKDRAALFMIEGAEKNGELKKGGLIIEPTSGNTGIGIAYVCKMLGYKAVIVMPDSMSVERINIIKSYGAEVVLTPGALGIKGSVDKAEEINKKTEGSIIAGQFYNPDNKLAHIKTTAPEIDGYFKGTLGCVIAGIGTGGTVSGIGEYFKKNEPTVKIFGVEPASSPLLTKGFAGSHKIQGIGANFVPTLLNKSVIDGYYDITDGEAFDGVKELYKLYGLKLGISSGAAYSAAKKYSLKNKGQKVLFISPDGEDRYLSMNLYE